MPTATVSSSSSLQERSEKHPDGHQRKTCLLDPPPPTKLSMCIDKQGGVCVKEAEWLNVSFEIEMYALESNTELKEKGLEPNDALKKGMAQFKAEILGSVTRDPPDSCNDALFDVHSDDDEHSWMWELEKHEIDKPYMMEASSPQAMTQNETEIAITQTSKLQNLFSKYPAGYTDKSNPWEKDPPGLHVHVASKCLLQDVKRIVAVLLIWERFDSAIYKLTGSTLHEGEAGLKAAPISEKSPKLLAHLLSYITKDGWSSPSDDEALGDYLNKPAVSSRSNMHGDKEDADGFRRFEVNVCHLLHVKCAHDLPEKEAPQVPKFGALEFRGFDPIIGEPLRLIIMLVVRLVQFGCNSPLTDDGLLHKLAYWDGENEAEEVKPLFDALDIPFESFHKKLFTEAKFAKRPKDQPNKEE